jgi:hypothetical protein
MESREFQCHHLQQLKVKSGTEDMQKQAGEYGLNENLVHATSPVVWYGSTNLPCIDLELWRCWLKAQTALERLLVENSTRL